MLCRLISLPIAYVYRKNPFIGDIGNHMYIYCTGPSLALGLGVWGCSGVLPWPPYFHPPTNLEAGLLSRLYISLLFFIFYFYENIGIHKYIYCTGPSLALGFGVWGCPGVLPWSTYLHPPANLEAGLLSALNESAISFYFIKILILNLFLFFFSSY